MSERMDGWRECADPVELAAAVAAGVEVLCVAVDGRTWETGCEDSESFRRCMANGCRYRVPPSWSWSPEPPADVPTGAERYLAERLTDPEYAEAHLEATRHLTATVVPDGYEVVVLPVETVDYCAKDGWGDPWEGTGTAAIKYGRMADAVLAVLPTPAAPVPPWPGDENDDTARLSPDQGDRIVNACCRMLGCEPADIDGDAALEEILTEAVERCADLHGQDRWEDDCHGCGFRVGDHTTDGRCPAPAAPVPPWPGAVLSGLTDEDGQPTWLAQAGQVRGEQVRRRSDFEWVNNDQMVAHLDTVWVEVRAPRAVPVPETERVPWWEAVGRGLAGSKIEILEVGSGDEGPWVRVVEGGTKLYSPVAPDGTVKVLKDGDQ